MLTIYGVYRSRASRVYWLAEEVGLPFRHVPVIQKRRLAQPDAPDAPLHTRAPAFLAVNPNGHIPSIDDDGLVLHESLAITLYLAKKHGGALAPADTVEDGLMTMWSLWAATEVEQSALVVQGHGAAAPAEARDPVRTAAAVEGLRKPFSVLDQALSGTGWLIGGRFTVADINVAEIVRYAASAVDLFDRAPHVKAWLDACQARPAFKAMWARRELEPA